MCDTREWTWQKNHLYIYSESAVVFPKGIGTCRYSDGIPETCIYKETDLKEKYQAGDHELYIYKRLSEDEIRQAIENDDGFYRVKRDTLKNQI